MDRDGVFDYLEEKMDGNNGTRFNIIIDYSRAPTVNDVTALNGLGLTPSNVFEVFKAIGVNEVPGDLFDRILRLPGVVMIEEKGTPFYLSDIATPTVKAKANDVYPQQSVWDDLGYKGEGTHIAIMDTGVDNEHPSLKGKWLGGVDVSKPDPIGIIRDGSFDADDTQGHGTSCAGMAMGTGAPSGDYQGTAPEAKLIDIRIGTIFGAAPGEGPQDFYDGTLQGIEWAMDFKDENWGGGYVGIPIISLSWGNMVGGSSDGTDIYSRALEEAIQAGIIVVGAAGNDGPSNDGFDGLAAADSTISVGSLYDRNTLNRSDDIIAGYSSRGPRKSDGDSNPFDELKPDISSPGTDINNANFQRTGDGSGGDYGPRGSGTSYATPNAAGVVALILQANPDLTREQVRAILHISAEQTRAPTLPDLDPKWNKDYGYGMLDAYEAVRLAELSREMPELDTSLYLTFTNVSFNETLGTNISGVVWSRGGGEADRVEVRIDGGEWNEVDLEMGERFPEFSYDPGRLAMGNYTIEVRSWSGTVHSLIASETLWVDGVMDLDDIAGSRLIFTLLIISLIVLAGFLVFYIRFKPALERA